ncbi:IS1182 family transposase [Tautonia marina]|uniref:IS1182 family transposase n=1 Tax=Tautonia marina TaxID=2653855 RepID=UPI0036F23DE5
MEGDDGPMQRPPVDLGPAPPPRLRRPDREQMLMRPCSLDELIGDDHDARLVWQLVETWDLSRFLDTIRARGETPGRSATDPKLLVALWLYAATQGVAGGRELARLCESSDPYRWLCGMVPVNYHMLNDFRVAHGQALQDLLTQMLAVLIRGGLVTVSRIAQDGTRVRAGAGANSFKRRETIERALQQAQAHLEIIQRQADRAEDATERRRAAETRAAQRKVDRMRQALDELAKVEQAKAQQKAKPSRSNPARASTTDPESRYMRMPDGGSRPAYNVQLAVDTESRAIVGVDVTNAGSDAGLAEPMRGQIAERTGGVVQEHLVDGGYVKLEDLDRAAASEPPVTMTMPVPRPRKKDADPHRPKATDSEAVAQWRRRMGTSEAKSGYKDRAATVETVNGELKSERGLTPFRVRGLPKVRCVALWCALAYNVMHFGWQMIGLAA